MSLEVDLAVTWQVESGEMKNTVHVACLRSLPRPVRPLVLSKKAGGGSCDITVSFRQHHCLVSSITVWSSAKTVEIYGKPWNGRDSEYMCTVKGVPSSSASKQLIEGNKQENSSLLMLENSTSQMLSSQDSKLNLSLDFSDTLKEEQEIRTSQTRKALRSEFSESEKGGESDVSRPPALDKNVNLKFVNVESTKQEINTVQPLLEENDNVEVPLNISDSLLTTVKQLEKITENIDVPKQEIPKELSPFNPETNENGDSAVSEDLVKKKKEGNLNLLLFQNSTYEAKAKLSRIDPWSQTTIKLLSLDGDKTKAQILSIHLEVTRGPPKSALPFTPLPPSVNFLQSPNASSNPFSKLSLNSTLEMKPGLLNEIGNNPLKNDSLSSFLPLLSQNPNLTMSNLSSLLSSSTLGGKGEVGTLSDIFAAMKAKGGGGGGEMRMEQLPKFAQSFLKYRGEKQKAGERREKAFSGAFLESGLQNGISTLPNEGRRVGTTEDGREEVAELKFEETQVKSRKDDDGKKIEDERTETFVRFSEEMLTGLEKVYRKLERLESVCERIENRMESNLKAMDSRIQSLEKHVGSGNTKGITTEDR